jgi:hypothetical protein
VSSHGRVAPKTKTINVEVNLLAQRIAERDRLFTAAVRKLMLLGVAVVVSAVLLPTLFKLQSSAALEAKVAVSKKQALAGTLASLNSQQESAKPLIADKDLTDRLEVSSEIFRGHVTLLLNSATPDMAFQNLRAEANGTELKMTCKLDAETYPAVQAFVAAASKGPNVINAILLSQKRGQELGESSVSFDFVKRVKLSE